MSSPLRMPLANVQRLANSARHIEEWPFPWEQMPPDGRVFNAMSNAAVDAPAYGAANQVVVCSYAIPAGFTACIKAIMRSYSGSGWVEGSGDIVWDIDVDRPLGASPIIGWGLPDYTANIFSLGSPSLGPWKVPGAIIVQSGTIRMKARTVANVTVGAPNYLVGTLIGWIYPSS